NGDGRLDLVAVTNSLPVPNGTFSVLLNTTSPGAATFSFADAQVFAVGFIPSFVVAEDINGDGRPDLNVVNSGPDDVSVFLNTTTPGAAIFSFATQTLVTTGPTPVAVAIEDLNGDGKPDLAVANRAGDNVGVQFNTTIPGDATLSFTRPQTFDV